MTTHRRLIGHLARPRRGSALTVALLVTVLLAVLLTAGLSATSGERRVDADDKAGVDAFALAQAGLETFLAQRDSLGFTASPPAVSESARVTMSGGYADVVLTRVRTDTINGLYGYAVRSHGVITVASLTGTPQAQRTIAEYAAWQPGSMNVLAGYTSITGLHKNGGSAMGSGTDQCGKKPAVAGVAVPTTPGYTQNGGSSAPQGNPPILNVAPTAAQMAAQIPINWAGISNGTALTPDVTIPGGAWPSFANPNYWPTILVNGDYTLPGNGQGVLIVTGNLTLNGAVAWNGIVLVGDNVTSNGNNTIDGALVSGLNVILGQTVAQASLGNGTKAFNYNSCNVAQALGHWSQLSAYTNAWVDNWSTY